VVCRIEGPKSGGSLWKGDSAASTHGGEQKKKRITGRREKGASLIEQLTHFMR
jgi:hypothetical protein